MSPCAAIWALTALSTLVQDRLSDTPVQTLSEGPSGSKFGQLVALADVNGDGTPDLIVTRGDDAQNSTSTHSGAVRIFFGGPSGFSAVPDASLIGPAGAAFGAFLATGDFNGDGRADVALTSSAFNQATGQQDLEIRVHYGLPAGLNGAPDWTFATHWIWDLAGVGDVNGDGSDELVFIDDAGAFLFYGSAAGLAAAPGWTFPETAHSLSRASAAGDVNGDGFGDVILTRAEGVGVFLGSSAGLAADPQTTLFGTTPDRDGETEGFGMTLADVGDMNQDGFGDIAVGAPGSHRFVGPVNGRVYLYHGSAAGVVAVPARILESQGFRHFGFSIAAGDVNGDGRKDLAVGSIVFAVPGGRGQVDVFHGSATGFPDTSSWRFVPAAPDDDANAGASLAMAPVNGIPFLVVGGPGDAGTSFPVGKVFLFTPGADAGGGAPAAPAGLTATAGDGQVTLTWNAVTDATSYTLRSATVAGGPYGTVQSGIAGTSFVDASLINGTTYFYVVTASNARGEGPASAEVSATPSGGAPPPPDGTGGSGGVPDGGGDDGDSDDCGALGIEVLLALGLARLARRRRVIS